jgi:hypothetical protein
MNTRIMYVELKSHGNGHDDNGSAWITRVSFSKTGKSIYFKGKFLQKYNAGCGNYIDPNANRGILGFRTKEERRRPLSLGERENTDRR